MSGEFFCFRQLWKNNHKEIRSLSTVFIGKFMGFDYHEHSEAKYYIDVLELCFYNISLEVTGLRWDGSLTSDFSRKLFRAFSGFERKPREELAKLTFIIIFRFETNLNFHCKLQLKWYDFGFFYAWILLDPFVSSRVVSKISCKSMWGTIVPWGTEDSKTNKNSTTNIQQWDNWKE